MSRDRIVELATYIIVMFMAWVGLPLAGKLIDTLYFGYPNVLAESAAVIVPGAILIVIGFALGIWTVFLFKTIGQGTPNPGLPPKVLVIRGPYRFSRNPMALGGLLLLVGESVIYYSPSLLGLSIVYAVAINLYVMAVEEPTLKQRFGDPYLDYLTRVPRFFPNPWKWYGQDRSSRSQRPVG